MSWNHLLNSPRLRPWLELFRLPNLCTASGDALAGLAIASLSNGRPWPPLHSLLLALAITLIYAAGLAGNDLADLQEDARLRPERPLPSRRLSTNAAQNAIRICLLLAILLLLAAPLQAKIALLLLILLCHNYNHRWKAQALPGAISMGLCRGFSLLTGAALLGLSWLHLPLFLGTTAFIASVTWLADRENQTSRPDWSTMLPLLSLLLSAPLQLLCLLPALCRTCRTPLSLTMLLCGTASCLFCLHLTATTCLRLYHSRQIYPAQMQKSIGTLLGALLPWQAGWLLLSCSPWGLPWGALLLLFIPLSSRLRRQFAAS